MILDVIRTFLSETYNLFIEISPYLILGFFFAGLLHTLLGEKYIQKHFSKSGILSTIKAVIFGIPLPICSCGVIPLAESLRREGASKSSTMGFLVSTPSSGIDSIFATYALLGPIYAIFRPLASFFGGIFMGIIVHFVEKKEKKTVNPPKEAKTDTVKQKKSFKQVFNYGFKVIPSEISKSLIIGVLLGGAISALIPSNLGTDYLQNPILSYLLILVISIPLYVCATGSIPIAVSLITKGVLPGAALAFLIAGPATNTVTVSFVYKKMGKRVAFLYVMSIIFVAVSTGLLFDLIWKNAADNITLVAAGGKFIPLWIKIISAIILSFIFLNSMYDFSRFRRSRSKEFLKIKVPDMTCQHCKTKITDSLTSVPGINSLSIDLKTREILVDTDLEKQIIINRIQDIGYNPIK
jgi:uncharacterized membrane protein YraQ (UPF0718 family)/copper chaperone CopZ